MSSVQHLREFISQRLTAAAEEIFSEFEKIIVQYEEEVDRQRGLLDITWKPQINLHRIDLPQEHGCKEEEDRLLLADQQLRNQERNASVDPEAPEHPQIKEEQEELCITMGGEQETDTFMLTPTCQQRDFSDTEPNTDQLYSHNSPSSQNQEGSHISHSNSEDNSPVSENLLDLYGDRDGIQERCWEKIVRTSEKTTTLTLSCDGKISLRRRKISLTRHLRTRRRTPV
ncbi:uncharacterized protein PAE49_015876 isoform 2-T2 [Odontesthes bonariensis]